MEIGRLTRLLAALLAAAVPLPVSAGAARPAVSAAVRAQASENERISAVFARDAEREKINDPLDALYRGDDVDPEALSLLYTDTLDRRALASARQGLAELSAIDRGRLGREMRVSYDVFARAKREEIAWLSPDTTALVAVRPFNHFGGLHVEFASLVAKDGALPYDSVEDYRRALRLEEAFAQVLDNAVLRFREGMRTGVVESKLTVRNMVGQLDALLNQPLEQSPFYSPVTQFPDTVPAASRRQLSARYAVMVREKVNPALARLRRFLAEEYLPAARDEAGLSAMKGGAGLYRMLIERETTLRLDPEDIHRSGLAEVTRIQGEMRAVQQELGYGGTLRDFFETLRTDRRFHPATANDLTNGFARIAREVDLQIPRFFARVPRTPLVIRPYPEYRARYEAGGSYNEGSADGSRPGVFYFNTYDLPSRFLTGMTTLYLHEGAPGHHFQISLAMEDEALPDFQRFGGNNAFIEGWALYAETLGYDMGLYRDPEQHWGTLDDEMLRAMRLVVDTGLHAKGWTRDQAIAYMLDNSGMGRTDATAEVERYIANPAQALSYKTGSMTIQRLRRKAEAALGDRFDIREFHDQVLGSGALPLQVLESKIDGWIATAK